MQAIRTTRVGGILCIGVIVIANLVQPMNASALDGVSLPPLDELVGSVQPKPAVTQSLLPVNTSLTPPQSTNQPLTSTSEQPIEDTPTNALKLDTPELIRVTPSPNNLHDPIVLSWKAVDGADHYEYQYNTNRNLDCKATSGQSTPGAQTSVEFTDRNDGVYYWCVRAIPPTPSTHLLASDWSDVSSFMIDQTPPTATLPAPGTIKDGAQLAFTATDPNNGSGVAGYNMTITDNQGKVVHQDESVALPDQSGSYSYAWPGGLPNGQYTLLLAVTDKAGNLSSPVTASLQLANDLPQTSAMIGPDSQVASDTATLTISGQASANTSIVRIMTTSGVIVDDVTPNTDGTWEYSFGNLHAGIYQFYVTALDAAGNRSRVTLQVQATVVAYTPPIITGISPDITASLSRPSAFTPLTTIVDTVAQTRVDAAIPSSIASIAPDLSIDSTGKSHVTPTDTSGQVLAASTSGWRLFGIGWQWWVVAALVGGVGWWLLRSYRFSIARADDM